MKTNSKIQKYITYNKIMNNHIYKNKQYKIIYKES